MRPHYHDGNIDYLLRLHPSHAEDGAPEALPRQTRYGSAEAEACGLVPVSDYADELVQPDQFKEVIAECHAKKMFPMYHMEASGLLKRWTQDGYGFCWAYWITACLMGKRALEGQTPVALSPFSLGWLVGWRNQGYYLDRTIAGAKEKGIAPLDFVPEYELNTRNFKQGWEQEALNYRASEWWDVNVEQNRVGTILNPLEVIRQALTILRTGVPLYIAYNWWGHALTCVGMEYDESKPNKIKWLDWNSHNDGIIELSGSKGVPNELYGIRSASLPGVT
jgi:hypothetical protein